MIIVNDYLWVGSHSGAKVYDAANRKTKGHWVTKIIVTAMYPTTNTMLIKKPY